MDHRLFSLTVLISSYFIYNQIGAIDENAISSLSIVTQIVKSVAIWEGETIQSEYQLSQFAPRLLWILRDHVLLIRDLKNNKV